MTTIRDNVITGGDTASSVEGIRFANNGAPIVITGNTIDVGPTQVVRGINGITNNVAGERIVDNFSRATGNKQCLSNVVAVGLSDSRGVLERNRLFAVGGSKTHAVEVGNGGFYELYSNHLWAGSSDCAGGPGRLLSRERRSRSQSADRF